MKIPQRRCGLFSLPLPRNADPLTLYGVFLRASPRVYRRPASVRFVSKGETGCRAIILCTLRCRYASPEGQRAPARRAYFGGRARGARFQESGGSSGFPRGGSSREDLVPSRVQAGVRGGSSAREIKRINCRRALNNTSIYESFLHFCSARARARIA